MNRAGFGKLLKPGNKRRKAKKKTIKRKSRVSNGRK